MTRHRYHCEICDQAISAGRYRRHRVCSRRACLMTWWRAFWRRVRKGELATVEEMARASRYLRSAAEQTLGCKAGDARTIVVPANSRRIVNLPERRRRIFRDLLTSQISAAAATRASQAGNTIAPLSNDEATHTSGAQLQVLRQACATCKGHCCQPGYNTALISARTVLRYMQDHPESRPRDVLQAYLDRLPAKSYEHSCVYHTAEGCNLPRSMRSTTCNTYFCENMHVIREEITVEPRQPWLIIAAQGKTPARASLINLPVTPR